MIQSKKNKLREELENHMEVFLNNGGEITVVPTGKCSNVVSIKHSITTNRLSYGEENKFNYDSVFHATK